MNDLISRKELIETIENIRARYGNDNSSLIEQGEVLDLIADAPTIEAEPVKHGYWVEMERGHYFKCSECRNPIPYKFGWKLYNGVIFNKRYYNYCPNCGAKMV